MSTETQNHVVRAYGPKQILTLYDAFIMTFDVLGSKDSQQRIGPKSRSISHTHGCASVVRTMTEVNGETGNSNPRNDQTP